MAILFWGFMIAARIFVTNMVSLLKNTRDNQEKEYNTMALCYL